MFPNHAPAFDDGDKDSSSPGLGGSNASSEDDLDVLPKPSRYEEAKEEDNWTKPKRAKKARHSTRNHSDGSGDSPEDDDVFDGGDAAGSHGLPAVNGSERKRVNNDGGGVDSSVKRSRPDTRVIGSTRKRVFESRGKVNHYEIACRRFGKE